MHTYANSAAAALVSVKTIPRTAVTSMDVASLAGVSQSAVSRTFTAGASVGEATRRKVLAAAGQLGYAPNAHARSLITGRSRIIGLVVSNLDNLFYPAVLQKLSQRLQTDGYHVLLFVSEHEDGDDLVRELLQYRVDGIVLGATTLSSALARRCAETNIPVVLFNRVMADATPVHSVRSDNHFGGRTLARLLVEQGHQRIAYLAGREDSSTNLEREQGFLEGLAQAGQTLYARGVGDYDMARAREATVQMFADPRRRPDAVCAASDQMAIAVIDALRYELHLNVPDDVSVVGFDNVPQAQWPAYQLTTYEQPVEPMVESTVGLLKVQMQSGEVFQSRNIVVSGRICMRSSTAPRQAP